MWGRISISKLWSNLQLIEREAHRFNCQGLKIEVDDSL